ncbi:MAG: DUF6036 family nucleotidyltransferase [candidate division WOR-3 bacterium]
MFEKLLEKIAIELANAGVPYMVIGGQAVLLYGEPRTTRDIDITLGCGLEGLSTILGVINRLRLTPLVQELESFVKETMVLPVADESTGIRVDFIFSFTPYERQAIARATAVRIGTAEVRFAALEDVVIHKIFAGRDRDLEDVRTILLKNPRYDREYIEKWLGLFDRTLGKGLLNTFQKIAG